MHRLAEPNDFTILFLLTGKEYSKMARKRITIMRMMSPMKRHLNLRHTMNFMVLHGLVNQKKDVSGRLVVMENKREFVRQSSKTILSLVNTTIYLFKLKVN